MGKRILLLAGSPRKGGNSDLLCDAFMRGAEEAGHVAEKIYVRDLKLGGCMACYGCRNSGKCVQKDDMDMVLDKMVSSDVIVMATPVYFYSLSGQLKVFIDRTLPRYREIRNKEFYFIVTAADGNEQLERTMEALAGFTDCLPGAKVSGKLYGGGFYKPGEVAGSEAEQEAYQMGKQA